MHEHKATTTFLQDKENTMRAPVSNSVGMAILVLQKEYIKNLSDKEWESKREKCLNELKEIKDEKYQAAIQFILDKINEPIHPELDTVTLYFSESKSEKYVFPLKEVLALVWLAHHDNKKFMHAYPGDKENALAEAKKDFPLRLETFLKALENIRTAQVCHHGNRNELVFTLNKTYEGIDLIEDARSTIYEYLKDHINKKFWEVYPESKDQKNLLQGLLKWIIDNDPNPLLNLLNIKEALVKDLHALFIKHGSDPKAIQLDTVIEEALPSLEFSCNPKTHPTLYLLKEILGEMPEKGEEERNAALIKMQDWIKANYQPKENDSLANYPDIPIFFALYQADKLLKANEFVLAATGKISQLTDIKMACEAYFKEKQTPNANVIKNARAQVVKAIYESKKATMKDEIENFFAKWFNQKDDVATKQKLYSLLIEEDIKEKIRLPDKFILDFIKKQTKEGQLHIEPYLINRVFLHAIITPVRDWTPLFTETLQQVVDFVKSNFNQEQKHIAQSLKRDSYPPELLQQIDYLLLQYKQEVKEDIARPPQMILMPEQVKTKAEWFNVAKLLSNKQRHQIFPAIAANITRILVDDYYNFAEHFSLIDILKSLPPESILSFMNAIAKDSRKLRMGDNFLFTLIEYIPNEDKLSFIKKNFSTDSLKTLIEKHNQIFEEFIKTIPNQDRFEFISSLDFTSLTTDQLKKLFFATIKTTDVALVRQLIEKNPSLNSEAKKAFLISTDTDVKRLLLSTDLTMLASNFLEIKGDTQGLFSQKPGELKVAITALSTALEKKLTSTELDQLIKTHPSLQKPPLEDYFHKVKSLTPLGVFLNHIVHGERDQAEAMLKAAENKPDLLKSLLCGTAQVTDYSGRTIEGTAYQMALGAWDVNRAELNQNRQPVLDEKGHIQFVHPDEGIADMIQGYFIKVFNQDEKAAMDEIRKQQDAQFPGGFDQYENSKEVKEKKEADLKALQDVVEAIRVADVKYTHGTYEESKGELIVDAKCEAALNQFRDYLKPKDIIKNGKHFNIELLVEAVRLYGDENRWTEFGRHYTSPKNVLMWNQVVGYIERYLPACYAQAFCQGLWYLVDEGRKLNRNLKFKSNNAVFLPLDSDSNARLGYEYAASEPGNGARPFERTGSTTASQWDYWYKLMLSKFVSLSESYAVAHQPPRLSAMPPPPSI